MKKSLITLQEPEYEFEAVKEEADHRLNISKKSSPTASELHMYMKALHHVLPMNYITVSILQSMFGEEANQNIVRKLIDKMTKEGYIESTNNCRLGSKSEANGIAKAGAKMKTI
ncbi:meiosis-specific protein ASY1-like [Rutidosis leptorrhynchoides]|uniref:meiosis-specific protein ASY1-like n=1 Tax=Rutidosis leptorrhynchoides TaxID=125765 RepID=UPI003A99DDB0